MSGPSQWRRTVPAGSATANPAASLLLAGLLPACAAGLATIGVGAFAGAAQAAGAAVGTVLVLVSMAAGPVIMWWTTNASPPAVMSAALGGYGALVIVLGLIRVVLDRVSWLSFGYLAAALLACCSAWLVGELRAATRLRVLVFGGTARTSERAAEPPPASSVEGPTRRG